MPTSRFLTPAEERALSIRMARGDPAAIVELVSKNEGLVMSIARLYHHHSGSLDVFELAQAGTLQLLRVIRRFDPDRGRFTTFARPWIRNGIRAAIRDEGAMIRVPNRPYYLRASVHAGTIDAASLTPGEQKSMAAAESVGASHISRGIPRAGDPSIVDPIAGLPSPEPEPELGDLAALPILLALLPPIEAEVLRLHYGLGGARPLTFREIGARSGHSRTWGSLTAKRALARLRLLDSEREGGE